MRYLRTQVLNRRAPFDQRLQVDLTNGVVMKTPNNLLMPKGTTDERPVTPVNGMIRYNTDIVTGGEVEVYHAGTWRSLRFKESTGITQQHLGSGDANNLFFGPLNPAPPAQVASNTSWGGQNLIVLVENVIQLHETNYTITQNPTIPGQTYAGDTSTLTSSGATVIEFDVTTLPIYPSVNIIGATLSGDSAIVSGTLITNYTVDDEDRLTSITIDTPTDGGMIAGTVLTITDASNSASGYFIEFTSAVPYGKPVTVLHGFDQ